MNILADLQIHSKYSRAVSKDNTIPGIYSWAVKKGIDLVATGDWTHPLWMKEIQENLEETGNGTLQLKDESRKTKDGKDPLFLLATEVSCIYSQGGKGHRVHTLVWVPTLDSANKISKEMTRQGCNLMSDGRPIIGLSNIQVAELVFSIEPKALVIPAHAWTPWFSVFGSMSGFDSIADSFGTYADKIYAIETGLSSNPSMNWQIEELDNRSILSFSDAHSGPKLGREATVFALPDGPITYDGIYDAIAYPFLQGKKGVKTKKPQSQVLYTIEFYPEEGKYHFTGHRNCNIRWGPAQTREKGTTCPVCGKPLTQGVLQRVEQLARRTEEDLDIEISNDGEALGMSSDMSIYRSRTFPSRKPYIMLVPLQEIIAECIGSPVTSKKVMPLYDELTQAFGGEFPLLLHATIADIAKRAGDRIAQGIKKVRTGDLVIDPGYDGVFGIVKLWKEGEDKPLVDSSKEQLSLL
jgi:PHP family Zn ribbon phosphoesterase